MKGSVLPVLTAKPSCYPPSCASLCIPLLHLLRSALPTSPGPILSVGCGAGLLEALLLLYHPSLAAHLRGVEILHVNRFLPEDVVLRANGTWHIVGEAREAVALMFTYPRETKLVKAYLDVAAKAEVVVWIGPRRDFEEYGTVLASWGEDTTQGQADKVVEPYERLAVFVRR